MRLNTIFDINKKKKAKRVGRGIGSGKGKTCGSGHKGQGARTGVAINGFEGGQMPITRRLPKRGFNNPNKVYNKTVNLGQIEKLVKSGALNGSKIDKDDLVKVGLISTTRKQVKLLAKGKLSEKINIYVDSCSVEAEKVVAELGGKVFQSSSEEVSEAPVAEKKIKKEKKAE